MLDSNEQHNVVAEIDLWTGDLKESLEEALKKKRLTDFLVSLAPTVSKELVSNDNSEHRSCYKCCKCV